MIKIDIDNNKNNTPKILEPIHRAVVKEQIVAFKKFGFL